MGGGGWSVDRGEEGGGGIRGSSDGYMYTTLKFIEGKCWALALPDHLSCGGFMACVSI